MTNVSDIENSWLQILSETSTLLLYYSQFQKQAWFFLIIFHLRKGLAKSIGFKITDSFITKTQRCKYTRKALVRLTLHSNCLHHF